MPRYDYYCSSCDSTTEIVRAFDDDKELLCSSCATPLVKKISATPVHFKGSGFYQTDK